MADIDKLIKVFKGLDYCSNSSKKCGSDCPYFANAVCCIDEMQRDALELLKKQLKTKVVFMRNSDGSFQTECGNCGTYLDKAYSRCPKCQKELDWNSNQT